MNKKITALLLLAASCFACSAFATNPLSKLITKHSSASHSMIKTHKATKQTRHANIDFTGTWIPNCGDGPEEAIEIENGENYIEIGGEYMRIGRGIQGEFNSSDEEYQYGHMSLEWSKDGSGLTLKDVAVMKDNIDGSAIQTIMGAMTLTMKNGQINLDGKLIGFEDLTQMEQAITIHCTFTKKQ